MNRRAALLGAAALALDTAALPGRARSQKGEPSVLDSVVVDSEGVLRGKKTGDEAAFFGVNYVAPFAFTYRALGYVGADREETIRRDLAHLKRLGMNAIRLHLWEAEISDADGNLLQNDHLRLLDLLIAQCRAHGIYFLMTAINWLGDGYPEADSPAPGFSRRFPKSQSGVDPASVAASLRFLQQLCIHTNKYTLTAYKDEPALVGIELLNEPWSPPQAQLAHYFETLHGAVRETGCTKPLFYCASQGFYPGLTKAIAESKLDGATFGWYPSGLVSHRTLSGNYLPRLDDYPLMREPGFDKKAKLIYEFDAADLDSPAMYPALARTFRSCGAQWATQFAYCPLPLAASNTPYPTHYVNLLHAPRQAMALRIAGEAFRRLPRGESYGSYPANATFGDFRIGHHPEVAELVTDDTYLHVGDTTTQAKRPASLTRIAGVGTSPVVAYEGTGCYFLDRLAEGVWRLEVNPDVVWIADPHGDNRLDREASRLLWRAWPMTITLRDLGSEFLAEREDGANTSPVAVKNGTIAARPGVYLLRRKGTAQPAPLQPSSWFAPKREILPPAVVHRPPAEAYEARPVRLDVTVATTELPESVALFFWQGAGKPEHIPMARTRGNVYSATIPAGRLRPGPLSYRVEVTEGRSAFSFPGGELPNDPLLGPATVDGAAEIEPGEVKAKPAPIRALPEDLAVRVRARALSQGAKILTVTLTHRSGSAESLSVPLSESWAETLVPISSLRPSKGWIVLRAPSRAELASVKLATTGRAEVERIELAPRATEWTTVVRPEGSGAWLFDARRDRETPPAVWPGGTQATVSLTPDALALDVRRWGRTPIFAARHLLDDRWDTVRLASAGLSSLTVRARSPQGFPLHLALIDSDGVPWGMSLTLTAEWTERTVALSDLRPAPVLRVPVTYPGGLNDFETSAQTRRATLDPTTIEAVQFSLVGADGDGIDPPVHVEISSATLGGKP